MIILRNRDKLKERSEFVATIGFFDGVHLGHRYLIREMKEAARTRGLRTAVITFPQHPRRVLQTDYCPRLLNSLDERLALLRDTGVDYCFILDFTAELSQLTAEAFISVLSQQWRIKTLYIGYDHRFGRDRRDGFREYVHYAANCGMEVLEAPRLTQNEVAVSSSEIRKQLSLGHVETAAQLLSYPYRLTGRVVQGNQIGRTLGFPTANIQVADAFKLIPSTGVYAVRVTCLGQNHKGMLYIGRRPTLYRNDNLTLEVHILDFLDDIYTQEISLAFTHFLREDIRFRSLHELKEQLKKDAALLRSY
ncbi:MAG: riboflavin biosynthesis protein RibF [Tannerellaceae bacterium]|jgi:riboflavin kinase/FMN adenylyltransferase|nr:riboflavin biosynthesis protein RibF [Tannerellaceae bacterium]